jgi:signal peptidase I
MNTNINQAPDQQPENQSAAKSIGIFIWDLVKVFIISIVIILPIRYYVAQPFIVQGSSMEPNFHDGEYLIIDEFTYKHSPPQRGDVIVFKFPKNTSEYFIKRIIGLPGETVQVKDAKVTIFNKDHPAGFVLQENYLPNQNVTFGSDAKTTLGSDEFFVLGDHRLASSDSRYWGPVPRNDLVGRVLIRAYPFQSFTKFGHIQYNS